jgi:hypothetical protein
MKSQRFWRVFPAVAIALAGLVPQGSNAAQAADLQPYISPDFCAVIVIHPERIQESTLALALKSALPQQTGGDPMATVTAMVKKSKDLPKGMDVDKLVALVPWKSIHRIVLVVDSAMAKNAPGSAVIVQSNTDIDGEGIIAALTTDQQPAEANGVRYAKLKGKPGDTDGAALAADKRTLILGEESTVLKMLAKNEGDRPLLKQLQRASLKHDILIEFCAEPMWAGLKKSTGKSQDELLAATPIAPMGPMAKDVKSLSLRLNFSGESLLHGELGSGKPETALTLATLGKGQVEGAKQQFEKMKNNPPLGIPPMLLPILSKLGDEVFGGLEIKSEGPLLTVDLAMPASLPDALKAVAKLASAMMPPPGAMMPPPSAGR